MRSGWVWFPWDVHVLTKATIHPYLSWLNGILLLFNQWSLRNADMLEGHLHLEGSPQGGAITSYWSWGRLGTRSLKLHCLGMRFLWNKVHDQRIESGKCRACSKTREWYNLAGILVCVEESGEPQGWRCKKKPGPEASTWQIEKIELYLHHWWLLGMRRTVRDNEWPLRLEDSCLIPESQILEKSLWQWLGAEMMSLGLGQVQWTWTVETDGFNKVRRKGYSKWSAGHVTTSPPFPHPLVPRLGHYVSPPDHIEWMGSFLKEPEGRQWKCVWGKNQTQTVLFQTFL